MFKRIISHPAVEEWEDISGGAGLFGWDSDYKYGVYLKPGWVFLNGRSQGTGTLYFNTYAQFKHAQPVTLEEFNNLRG